VQHFPTPALGVTERDNQTLATALTVTDELALDDVPSTRFAARVVEGGIEHVSAFGWATSARGLDAVLEHALATFGGGRSEAALLELEAELGSPCLVSLTFGSGRVFGYAAARDRVLLGEAVAWLRRALPEAKPDECMRVPVTFWSSCGSYADEHVRAIEVPSWTGVAGNYPRGVRAELEPLLIGFRPSSGGQLVLWYGPPGTGKTHALRALAWEWRDWCEVHYVTDPERFFGNSSYMLDVLLREEDGEDESGREPRWRLLVLEDTGELLAADAKEQTGQGLSRLLNVVDGIIGQGLRILVLVTTNEELRRLHPAVSRPGRCASKIEFRPFTAEEAAEWLGDRGSSASPAGARTLAELYGLAGGAEVAERAPVGFGS
jgi:hypothetical protein